jgi:trigger factor
MKVDIEDLSSVKKKVTVELPAETVDKEFSDTYGKLAKSASVKGFRPGKAPKSVLRGYYGKQVAAEVKSKLISDSFEKIMEDHDLDPVEPPEIEAEDEAAEGEDLKFEFEIEVKPSVEAQGYKGLAVKKEKLEIADEMVEDALTQLRESRAQVEPVTDDRGLNEGDLVVADLDCLIDGEPIEGYSFKEQMFDLELDTGVPELKEHTLGMKQDETREFDVTYPEDYRDGKLAGKDVTVRVHLRDIKRKNIPELDDDFAKDIGEFTSLDELREDVKEKLTAQEKERIDRDLKGDLVLEMIQKNPFEVPSSLVDKQSEFIANSAKQRLAYDGVDIEKIGLNLETMAKNYRERAENQVRASFLFRSIIEKEDIDVTSEELSAKLDEMVASYGEQAQAMRTYFEEPKLKEDIKQRLLEEKVLDYLVSEAKVTEVDPEEYKRYRESQQEKPEEGKVEDELG